MKELTRIIDPDQALVSVSSRLQDLVDSFLSDHSVKEQSKKTYKRNLRIFTSWYNALMSGRALDRNLIKSFRRHLEGLVESASITNLTANNYLTTVRKLFAWYSAETGTANIAVGIKGFGQSRGFRKDTLIKGDVVAVLQAANSARDKAILYLLITCGRGTIEIVRADYGDIRPRGDKHVLEIKGKGRSAKDEEAVLTATAMKLIREYLQGRGTVAKSDPLFASDSPRNKGGRLTTRSVSRIAKETLRFVGIDDERITAHSFRHTAITMARMAALLWKKHKPLHVMPISTPQ